MHDLQLVGFTTDRRGLIFRTKAGARAESYVVPVTDELVALVTQLAAGGTEDEPPRVEAAPVVAVAEPRAQSQLSVREIQARLRAGEDVARVAREAGVDEAWIERFAPPVRAEQGRIVERALACHLERPRAGASVVPLRRAVGMAMADKGIAFTVAAFEAAWSSRLIGHDRWAVQFTYRHRGKDRTAVWDFDAADGSLTTTDRTASLLGFVSADGHHDPDAGAVIDGVIGDPDATPIGTAPPPPKGRRPGAGGASRTAPSTAVDGPTSAPTSKPAAARPTTERATKKVASGKKPARRSSAAKATGGTAKSTTTPAAPTEKAGSATKRAAGTKPTPKRAAATGRAASAGTRAAGGTARAKAGSDQARAATRSGPGPKAAPGNAAPEKEAVPTDGAAKKASAKNRAAKKASAKRSAVTMEVSSAREAGPTTSAAAKRPATPKAAPAREAGPTTSAAANGRADSPAPAPASSGAGPTRSATTGPARAGAPAPTGPAGSPSPNGGATTPAAAPRPARGAGATAPPSPTAAPAPGPAPAASAAPEVRRRTVQVETRLGAAPAVTGDGEASSPDELLRVRARRVEERLTQDARATGRASAAAGPATVPSGGSPAPAAPPAPAPAPAVERALTDRPPVPRPWNVEVAEPDPDRTAARRARAAERNAHTVQFRSGAAAPVRVAGERADERTPVPPSAGTDRAPAAAADGGSSPAVEANGAPPPVDANGAARPRTRRRRQLRAR